MKKNVIRKTANKLSVIPEVKKLESKVDNRLQGFEKKLDTKIEKVEDKIIDSEEKISDLDEKIVLIQKSTKTLFKIFGRSHNWLRANYKFYYNWHLKPYADTTHWVLLTIAFILAIYLVGFQFGFFGGIKPESHAAAGIPKMVNYQGKLTDLNDIPVADGSYNFVLKIYDSEIGGSCLWAWKGTCGTPVSVPITVSNGVFSVLLGDSSFQSTNPLNLDFNTDAYYLSVQVGTDPEMTPRKRIGAVGYAYNSDTVDGKHETDLVLKDGRAGGQIVTGGTNANDKLTLKANSATSGNTPTGAAIEMKVGDSGGVNAFTILNNGNVGVSAVNPTSLLQLGTPGTTPGSISIAGSVSGIVKLQTAATTATYTLTLPNSAGTGGYVLSTDGTGVLSWINPPSGSSYWTLSGNNIYNNNSGNVGVNVTTPESTFHVNGSTTNTASRGAYSNLTISNNALNPNSQIDVNADSLVLWNTSSSWSREWRNVIKTLNLATSGVNGLDTGSEAASTWYYLYAIGKADGTVDGLISASATAPTMPSGYVYKMRVGSFYNNAASNIVAFKYANGFFQWRTAISVLTSGTGTSPTAVSLTTAVPVTAGETRLSVWGSSNNTTVREIYINSNNLTNGTSSHMWGRASSAVFWNEQGNISLETAQTIYRYANNINATLNINIVGYTDLPVGL